MWWAFLFIILIYPAGEALGLLIRWLDRANRGNR
jgi:hypothetical protein